MSKSGVEFRQRLTKAGKEKAAASYQEMINSVQPTGMDRQFAGFIPPPIVPMSNRGLAWQQAQPQIPQGAFGSPGTSAAAYNQSLPSAYQAGSPETIKRQQRAANLMAMKK